MHKIIFLTMTTALVAACQLDPKSLGTPISAGELGASDDTTASASESAPDPNSGDSSASAPSTGGASDTSAAGGTGTSAAGETGTSGTGMDTDETDPFGDTDSSATGWETGGLSCAGQPITHLADARLIAAADLPELPAWAEPEGHVLVLSSVPAICDAPLQGPACGTGHEYRLFIALPPGFEPGIYYFGVLFLGPEDAPDLKSWIVLSHTQECGDGGQLPEGNYTKGAMLEVDSFDPATSSLVGRLCGAYQPGLGDLAGEFAAQGCG